MAMVVAAMEAQQIQVMSLREKGFVVKNTFIDVDASVEEGATATAARRERSAPPTLRTASMEMRCKISIGDACSPLSAASTCCESPLMHERRSMSRRTNCSSRDLSPASTAYDSDSSPSESSGSSVTDDSPTGLLTSSMDDMVQEGEAAGFSEETDSIALLAALVERECGFLRLAGYSVLDETSPLRRRRGAAKCMILFVRDLPWVKRAKWTTPLLWCMVAVLKKHGIVTKMQGAELYVELPGATDGCTDLIGHYVRVDFAAAR